MDNIKDKNVQHGNYYCNDPGNRQQVKDYCGCGTFCVGTKGLTGEIVKSDEWIIRNIGDRLRQLGGLVKMGG